MTESIVKVSRNLSDLFELKLRLKHFNYEVIGRDQVYKDDLIVDLVVYSVTHSQVDGYEVVAINKLDKDQDVILTHKFQDTPDEYVNVIKCEHCNKGHVKVMSFVIVNTNNGEYKMVGKGCLDNYIPKNIQEEYLVFSDLCKLYSFADDGFMKSGSYSGIEKQILVGLLYDNIKAHGFVSKTAEEGYSTLSRTINDIESFNGDKKDLVKISDATYVEFLNFLSSQTSDSFHNAKQLILNDCSMIDYSEHTGNVLYAVLMFIMSEEHRANGVLNEVLRAGDYKDVECFVESIKVINTMYGETQIVSVIFESRRLNWFTTAKLNFSVGDTIKCNIVSSGEYNSNFNNTKVKIKIIK